MKFFQSMMQYLKVNTCFYVAYENLGPSNHPSELSQIFESKVFAEEAAGCSSVSLA